jgi:hypothetical protein
MLPWSASEASGTHVRVDEGNASQDDAGTEVLRWPRDLVI